MADSFSDWIAMLEYQQAQKEREANAGLREQQRGVQSGLYDLQSKFYDMFAGAEKGGVSDPALSPWTKTPLSLAKNATASQFNRAKENIFSTIPVGGMQQEALGDLETNRAKIETELPQFISDKIIKDMMDKSYGATFGSNIGNASAVDTSLLQNAIQRGQAVGRAREAEDDSGDAALWGALGSLLSLYVGGWAGPVLAGAAGAAAE